MGDKKRQKKKAPGQVQTEGGTTVVGRSPGGQ